MVLIFNSAVFVCLHHYRLGKKNCSFCDSERFTVVKLSNPFLALELQVFLFLFVYLGMQLCHLFIFILVFIPSLRKFNSPRFLRVSLRLRTLFFGRVPPHLPLLFDFITMCKREIITHWLFFWCCPLLLLKLLFDKLLVDLLSLFYFDFLYQLILLRIKYHLGVHVSQSWSLLDDWCHLLLELFSYLVLLDLLVKFFDSFLWFNFKPEFLATVWLKLQECCCKRVRQFWGYFGLFLRLFQFQIWLWALFWNLLLKMVRYF